MSEQNSRSIEQIQQEYQSQCLKAGHVQYQISALQQDLDMINQSLRELNLEASMLKQKEEQEKVAKLEGESK